MGLAREPLPEGTVLWEPSPERVRSANVTRYLAWLARERGLHFDGYHDLQRWSASELEAFWGSLWDWLGIRADGGPEPVLAERRMPGARWFPNVRLSYAEHALARADGGLALVYRREDGLAETLTYAELRRAVGAVAAGLAELGVGRGDRVAAFLPNLPETVIAFLATASLGAVWSSCSPDLGPRSVADRFRQIEPKVLLAVDGYLYGGNRFERGDVVARIQAALPTLEATVYVSRLGRAARPPGGPVRTLPWEALLANEAPLACERVPFDHPLWILFSSGTTGPPKSLVHGHGGVLLEHLKSNVLRHDLGAGDTLLWFTTTSWMMWNVLVSGLLVGSTVLLYDGSPSYPSLDALWAFAADARASVVGAGAPFLTACQRAGLAPGERFDLGSLRVLGSTAAPLPAEGYRWVYERVKEDVLLDSASGGTEVACPFVGGSPVLPVYAGELAARCLGVAAAAYDERGRPVACEPGELVITEPMPSMPVSLWNDPGGSRYRESYFERFPGVWHHGDLITFTERGSCVIGGRSDATIKRAGVRMGSGEFYPVVEALRSVVDSLVVDTAGRLWLFVQLVPGAELDAELEAEIRATVREELSPRHQPDAIVAVPGVPRTLNGKKLEVPVRRILMGADPGQVVDREAMANPETLPFFVALAGSSGASS